MLLVVSALTFWLLSAAGGDALTALAVEPTVSERALAEARRVYGLDQPLAARYLRWLGDFARGRMGYSFHFHAPVSAVLWPRLLRTLALALAALLFAWSVALGLGALAARRAGSFWDRLSDAVILLAASTPRLVLALLALALAARTGLLDAGPAANAPPSFYSGLARLLLPALVLGLPLVAVFLAQTREGLGAALGEEFVRTARAKGLPERDVLVRHALRAALNPLITIFGYSLGGLVSGSIVVETVLNWQGLGALSVTAVQTRDVSLLMAVVVVTASAVLAGNLAADLLLRWNDPRLRR